MTNSKFSVVMIDDQPDFLSAMESELDPHFRIHAFTNPKEALTFLDRHPPEAVLLDFHIPGNCAWETLKKLHSMEFHKPVMILTGESDLKVKIEGLERGFDDFLQKPITGTELSAYLKNRIHSSLSRNPELIKLKNLTMNFKDPEVQIDHRPVKLTNKEFEILKLLVSNPNTVITKERILKKIWSNVTVEKNNIDTHMSNLRKKISGFECSLRTIKTIGYVLRVR